MGMGLRLRWGVGMVAMGGLMKRELIQIMSIYNNNNPRTTVQTGNYGEQTPKRGQPTRKGADRFEGGEQTAAKMPSSTAETKKVFKSPSRPAQDVQKYENINPSKVIRHQSERNEQQNAHESQRYKKNEGKEASRGKDRLKSKLACIIDTINEQDSVATVSYYEQKTQRSDSEQSQSIQSNDRSPVYREAGTRQNRGASKQPQLKRETNKKVNFDEQRLSEEDSEIIKPVAVEKPKPSNKYVFYGAVKEEKVMPMKKQKKNEDQQLAIKPQYPQKDFKHIKQEQRVEQQSVLPLETIDYDYEKGKKKGNEHGHDRLRNKLGFIFKLINEEDEVASVSYYSERQSEQPQEENSPENRQKQEERRQGREKNGQNERQKKDVIFNQEHSPPESVRQHSPKSSPKSIKKKKEEDDGIGNSNDKMKQKLHQQNKQQNKPSNLKMLSKEQEEANLIRSDEQPKKKEAKDKQAEKGQKKPVEAMKQITRVEDFQEIEDILEEIQLKQNKAKNQVSRSMQNRQKQPISRYEKLKIEQPSESKKVVTSADKAISSEKLLKSIKPEKQKSITDKQKQKDKEKLTSQIQKSKSKPKLKQVERQAKGDRYDMPEPKMSGSKSNDSKFSIKLHQVDIKNKSRSSKEATVKENPIAQDNAKTIKKQSNNSKNSFEQLPQDMPAQPSSNKTVELPKKKSSYLQSDISGILLEESVKKKPNPKGNPFKQPVTPNRITTVDYNDRSESSQMSNFVVPKSKVEFRVEARRNIKTEMSQKEGEFRILTEDEKKFLSLLKKREENLAKRVKEQFFSNNAKLFPSEPSSKNKQSEYLRSNDVLDNIMDETRFPTQQTSQFNKGEQKSKMSMYEQDGTRPDELKDKPYFPTLTLSPRKDQSVSYFDAEDRRRINDSKKFNYFNAHKRIASDHASSDSSRLYSMGTEQFDEVRNPKKQTPSKLQFYNASKLHKDYSQRIKHNTNAKEKYERLKALLEQI